MENHSYGEIIGNSAAPYINQIAAQGASGANYFATDHPSLPNYAELTSAQSFANASTDCDPSSTCDSTAKNIADELEAGGKSWKAYEESMGTPCLTSTSGLYGARHDPFVYYTDITSNQARCQAHVVDYSSLATDLSKGTVPNYAFITPNTCNDMHDCSIQTGDTWLSQNVPALFASTAFTQQHSLLLVVFDEDDDTQNNQVPMIADGYSVKVGYASTVHYNHYSLLRTVEAVFGLGTLTSNDASAVAMTDLFTSSTSGPVSNALPTPSSSPSPTPSSSPSPAPSTSPSPSPSPSVATATPIPVGQSGSWTMTFDDEFAGTSLDSSKWTPGWFGTGVTGPVDSSELACYNSNHLSLPGDGSLHMLLDHTPSTCQVQAQYTGALISSNGKFQYTYGYVEFRLYVPASSPGVVANWPATWSDGQSWPTDGENDTMEGLDGQVCFHFHSPVGGPGACVNGDYTGWHTFGSYWQAGAVSYYYDGVKVGQVTSGITSAPQYLIVDYTVESGSPTVVPASLLVDYVRVWTAG